MNRMAARAVQVYAHASTRRVGRQIRQRRPLNKVSADEVAL